jgi:hypothetical protein
MKKKFLLALILFIASPAFSGEATPPKNIPALIMDAAKPWSEQGFRVGKSEECMNWTRIVMQTACGASFATKQTLKPWDSDVLSPEDKLAPDMADSLAGPEFGTKIMSLKEVQAGDLVFLKNTYGDWAPGVITHVGIAVGNGEYMHRMTSNKGIVKTQTIPSIDFAYGMRLDEKLCE